MPTHNRQRLFTENMLFTHPPLITDSWTLYIKASILISRVRSLNSRYWISAASKRNGMSAERHGSPTESEEFRHLDQTIASFTRNIPRAFQDPVGTAVDPILYTAHILPHVYVISLIEAPRPSFTHFLTQCNDPAPRPTRQGGFSQRPLRHADAGRHESYIRSHL